ncbi:hypothetical protein ACRAWD_05405 [Caulobacter segnis]
MAAGVAQFGEVRDIPLNRSEGLAQERAARWTSIRSHRGARGDHRRQGALQPPVVEPEIKNGKATGYYLVTAGEGRRQALRLLVQRKALSKTVPVRCIVDTTKRPGRSLARREYQPGAHAPGRSVRGLQGPRRAQGPQRRGAERALWS